MSAKYAIQFGLLSIAAVLAAVVGLQHALWRLLFAWIACAFGIVAMGYALGRPGLLMKRPSGGQPLRAWLLLWPYFLLGRLSFALYRLSTGRGVALAEVVPGIWFARRLTRTELQAAGRRWAAVLDLAAEFPKVAINGATYLSLPMLDGAVPSEAQLREGILWLDEQSKRGDVLVHCALGHGRTGSVVLGWLLEHGHVPTAKEGIKYLAARRPSFGMSKAQTARVALLSATASTQR